MEDHCAERNHQHVTRIHRGVTDNADQDQHWRQQPPGGDRKHGAQGAIDEARRVGNADTEHCHQHHAERMEPDEGGHQVAEEGRQAFGRQQVDDRNGRCRARIDCAELDDGQQGRQQSRGQEKDQEEDGRIRQPIPTRSMPSSARVRKVLFCVLIRVCVLRAARVRGRHRV
jgi:hypothetical protein